MLVDIEANTIAKEKLPLSFCTGKQTPKVPKLKVVEFTNSIAADEEAHNEPPHQDLYCLATSL